MEQPSRDAVLSLQHRALNSSVNDVLQTLAITYPGAVVFSTSFSYEDQVITDMIHKSGADITLFTLDTGRLFPETYTVWSSTLAHYGVKIRAYHPDKKQLQAFVTQSGPNAFYESAELRKACCHIRKVVPLKKALSEKAVWVTGLRAEHSQNRGLLQSFEWDETNNIIKYHPLLHWTTDEVKAYINQHNVPYNALHDRGFVSIGCAPCTRAIKPGEDFRAGRWWWEDASKKECGLHVHQTFSK